MLKIGQADVVIEPRELFADQIPSQALFGDRWLCAVDAKNPQVRNDRLTMKQYLQLPHLVYSIGTDRQLNLADQHVGQLGVRRRIEVTVESFLLVPFLLEGTLMVSLILERAARRLAGITSVRTLKPPLSLPISTKHCIGIRVIPPIQDIAGFENAWRRLHLSCTRADRRETCQRLLLRPDRPCHFARAAGGAAANLPVEAVLCTAYQEGSRPHPQQLGQACSMNDLCTLTISQMRAFSQFLPLKRSPSRTNSTRPAYQPPRTDRPKSHRYG